MARTETRRLLMPGYVGLTGPPTPDGLGMRWGQMRRFLEVDGSTGIPTTLVTEHLQGQQLVSFVRTSLSLSCLS